MDRIWQCPFCESQWTNCFAMHLHSLADHVGGYGRVWSFYDPITTCAFCGDNNIKKYSWASHTDKCHGYAAAMLSGVVYRVPLQKNNSKLSSVRS